MGFYWKRATKFTIESTMSRSLYRLDLESFRTIDAVESMARHLGSSKVWGTPDAIVEFRVEIDKAIGLMNLSSKPLRKEALRALLRSTWKGPR